MKATLRECAPEEKRALVASGKHVAFGWRSWATATGFAFFAVAALVSYVARHYTLDVAAQWLVIGSLLVAWTVVSIPIYSRLRARFGGTALMQDIKKNMVSVERYDIDQVIAMQEYEDLGSTYFVLDRDGRVYCFRGQYLYEVEERGLFPSTQVEIVRAPLSGIVLAIKCSGSPVKPAKTIGPFRLELVRRGKLPEDGSAISVGWNEIEKAYA